MPKRGKKYRQAAQLVDRMRAYLPAEAVELAQKTSTANFDATVEVHLNMGVDPRHADQQVRGVVLLPHGTGKQVRILVFAEGEAEKIAQEAGALVTNIHGDSDYISSPQSIVAANRFIHPQMLAELNRNS